MTFDLTMCVPHGHCFFAEYLPRISAYQVAFSAGEGRKLKFSGRRVFLTRDVEGTREEEICQFPGHLPELDPGSLLDCKKSSPAAGPQQQQQQQLRFKSRDPNSPAGSKFQPNLDPPEIPSTTAIAIKCGFCSCPITKHRHCFKRVLPLPSDDWSEISGDAFCHLQHTPSSSSSTSPPPHSHTLTPHSLTPHSLTPREGDCLVGRDVVRVKGDIVISETIFLTKGVIMCGRCYSPLGVVMAEGVAADDLHHLPLEFTRSRVSLKITSSSMEASPTSPPPLPPPPPPPSVHHSPLLFPSFSMSSVLEKEVHLSHRLHSAVKDTTSFKLRIENQHRHVYLYLWMLNVVSHVTSNTRHTTSNQISLKFSGAISPPSPSHITHHPVLKLLYVVATGTSHAPWSRDAVEPLPLSEEECLWLCVLLAGSTLSLPPSQRTAREMNVGYLCVE